MEWGEMGSAGRESDVRPPTVADGDARGPGGLEWLACGGRQRRRPVRLWLIHWPVLHAASRSQLAGPIVRFSARIICLVSFTICTTLRPYVVVNVNYMQTKISESTY